MGKAANSSISLKQIHVTDNFWNKYVHLVKDVIIPYQWDILNDKLEDVETSHCIENFKIAAGEKEGEFQGAVFQDTDVAKWLEAVGFVLNYERDEKLEELEGAFLLFQEGNESFKKEALEYQKLKDVVKQFPHTKDELRKFLDHETAYEKNLKGNLYEKRKQLEAMQELKEDYQRVMKEYAPADDEMLNQMREHGAETVPENIKGRKKGR